VCACAHFFFYFQLEKEKARKEFLVLGKLDRKRERNEFLVAWKTGTRNSSKGRIAKGRAEKEVQKNGVARSIGALWSLVSSNWCGPFELISSSNDYKTVCASLMR
jgi:hypothetical protein